MSRHNSLSRHNIVFPCNAQIWSNPGTVKVSGGISANESALSRVTRALFALAERTKMDPDFTGESLSYTEMTSQSLKRKVSGNQDTVQTGSLNAIFENLMQVKAVRCPALISSISLSISNIFQDVERKTSIVSKGPPRNIYSSCN